MWDVETQALNTTFRHGHSKVSLFGITTFQTGSPVFVTDDILATHGLNPNGDEYYTWSLPDGENLGRFTTSNSRYVYARDGSVMYLTETGLGAVQILDPLTGEKLNAYIPHDDTIDTLALSPDGILMLTASTDGTIVVRTLE